MSKGQFNNRQKDISRVLRDRQARINPNFAVAKFAPKGLRDKILVGFCRPCKVIPDFSIEKSGIKDAPKGGFVSRQSFKGAPKPGQ